MTILLLALKFNSCIRENTEKTTSGMQTEELKTLNSDSLSEKARYHIDTIQKSGGDEEAGPHLRTRASELRTARRQDHAP